MNKSTWVLGVVFLLIGLFVLVLTDPPRSIYSGLFFLVIGTIMTAKARKGAP